MIARIDAREIEYLRRLFARRPVESVRIAGLLHAYGTGHAFLSTYRQSGSQTLLTQIDDTFLLLEPESGKTDYAELAEFLRWSPHFTRLLGPYHALEAIRAFLPGSSLQGHLQMTCAHPVPEARRDLRIERSPHLRNFYEFTHAAKNSEFNAWYADLSHRIRHRCARAYLLQSGAETVSACLISIESEWAGLISNVFTAPTRRGNGFATAIVSAATNDLLADGKRVVLECTMPIGPFYMRMGYTRYGETGTLTTA